MFDSTIERMADKLLAEMIDKGFLIHSNQDYHITHKGMDRINELVKEKFDLTNANKPIGINYREALINRAIEKSKELIDTNQIHPVEQLLVLETEVKASAKFFKTVTGKELLQ